MDVFGGCENPGHTNSAYHLFQSFPGDSKLYQSDFITSLKDKCHCLKLSNQFSQSLPYLLSPLPPLASEPALFQVLTSQRRLKESFSLVPITVGASNDGFGGLLAYSNLIFKSTGESQTPSNHLYRLLTKPVLVGRESVDSSASSKKLQFL